MPWVVPHVKGQKGRMLMNKLLNKQSISQWLGAWPSAGRELVERSHMFDMKSLWLSVILNHIFITTWRNSRLAHEIWQNLAALSCTASLQLQRACMLSLLCSKLISWPNSRVQDKISLGSCLNMKMQSYQYRDPYDKLRSSHDCLIFITGIPIPGKTVFILKQVSVCSLWQCP